MIVAGMATMPSRAHTAPRALAGLLPQVDRLWLNLDGFDDIPDFARHPKIKTVFGRDHGGLKAEGKYIGLALDPEAEIFVSADDDLLYPANYVRRLSWLLRLYPGKAAAGCHGSIFHRPVKSYVTDRKVRVFFHKQSLPWRRVDLLATNGTVHRVRDLRFDVREWTYRNQVDLNFLAEMKKAGIQGLLAYRARNWVRSQEEVQDDSIYKRLLSDDSVQTARINAILSGSADEQTS